MAEDYKNILSNVELDGPYFLRNSIVYNIMNKQKIDRNPLDLVTLEGTTHETVEFCDNKGIDRVEVINHSGNNLFIFEGQLLKAGYQDRVTLVSSLIENNCSDVLLPVACVEQDRNSGESKHFQYGSLGFPSLRQKIASSLTEYTGNASGVKANQQDIWNFIDRSLRTLKVNSQTRTINDLYDHEESEISRYADSVTFQDDAVGYLYVLGERIMVDLFHPVLFSKLNKKLLQGYVLDMLLHNGFTEDPGENYLMDWINSTVTKGQAMYSKGVGLGKNMRIESGSFCGNGLIYHHDTICLSLYNKCYQNN